MEPYIIIPTNNNGEWATTSFSTREEYADFVKSLFKEPGKYNFDDSIELFNEQSKKFQEHKTYCVAPLNSKDFFKYWGTLKNEDILSEKSKCRNGVIFINKNKTFYLTRDYYFWINFLPIYDKLKKKFTFPEIWDSQYHVALYELLAELNYKHVALLKKRQFGMTYFHMCKIINYFWFEQGATLKIGASLKDYINEKGAWKFLNEYRKFLNESTQWYRPCDPDKTLMWQQRDKATDSNGKNIFVGLDSVITGHSFEHDPTSGVGGSCHRKGTLVLMSDGKYKEINNIVIGDYILGIDNKPKKVLNLFEGISEIYKVNQGRGDSYYNTGDHLLYLINRDSKVLPQNKVRLIKTKDWENLTNYQKQFYVGVKNKKELEFYNNYQLPTLDPYYLGLWLGDGYRSGASLIINKIKDIEILDYLEDLSKKTNTPIRISRKEENRYIPEMYTVSFPISIDGKDTFFTKQFVKYNLYYNKYIPDEYLYGNVETRLGVIAGLIDTDGYYDINKGHFEICIKDYNLRKQVMFLCRSLGAIVREDKKASQEHIVHNRMIKYTETHSLAIYFQDSSIIPTLISRKQGNNIRIRNIHTSPIKNIESIGIEKYWGIHVEDELYYLEDLTIAHNCSIFYHEEAGIASKMDTTYEFIRPALSSGMMTTGLFIASGSVGDLKQCQPLKEMILRPEANSIYPVETNLLDDTGKIGLSGLFIPEQWSMPMYIDIDGKVHKCIDEYGNSLVEKALDAIKLEREQWKKDLSAAQYQLRISQKPINIHEAFAYREDSLFPLRLVNKQMQRIQEKTYSIEYVKLERDDEGKVVIVNTNKLPILDFPISKTLEDKTGVVCIHERPMSEEIPYGMYYASIDTVAVGKTASSDSLCTIYVWRNTTEVAKMDLNGQIENRLEEGKIVAWWAGRFDNINDTHKTLENIIDLYRAWTIVEKNRGSFIPYMIERKKQHLLVPTTQLLVFNKDMKADSEVFGEYGWNNSKPVYTRILGYLIDWLQEIIESIDISKDKDGSKLINKYGIEKLPDIMALKEMAAYGDGTGNFDRIISLAALMAFVKIQEANLGFKKRWEKTEKVDLEKSDKFRKFLYGGPREEKKVNPWSKPTGAFKNFR